MTLVKFTGVNHYIEAGAGEGYKFEFEGVSFVCERWATRNASGQDVYDESGEPVYLFDDEQEEQFNRELEEFSNAWMTGHALFVDDAFEKAEKHAVQAFEIWSAAYDADLLKWGDSNDAEIDALKGALESALSLLGMTMPSTEEPEDSND